MIDIPGMPDVARVPAAGRNARGGAPKVENAFVSCQFPARLSTALVAILLLSTSGCALFRSQKEAPVDPAATWRTHMGSPDRAGFEEEPVPEATPRILWTSDAGRGLTSPPVLSGEVLLAATTGRSVIALSAESGDRYWEHRKQGPLTVAPVVDEERIYVSTGSVSGRVYALRRHDGHESWRRNHPGVDVPLLLDGDRLYLASQSGYLSALRSESGEPLWNTFVGRAAGAPVVAGDRVLIGTTRDSLLALDAETGRIQDRRVLGSQLSASPAVRDGIAYLPLQSGELIAIRAETLELLWSVQAAGPILAAPAVGEDGTIYILDRTGVVSGVTPSGEIRRIADAGSAATGSLALGRNALLVGLLDGSFHAFDRGDGRLLWSVSFRDSIHSPVIIRAGVIYVPLRRGTVVKLQ